jgi:hypothetical protein
MGCLASNKLAREKRGGGIVFSFETTCAQRWFY